MNKDTEWRKEQGKSTAVEAGERRRDFGQDISAEEQREKRRDNDGRRSFSPSSSLTNKRSTDLSLASKEGDSPNRPGVMGDSGAEFELSRLKANAESLAGCLHSVLQKISELEQAEGVVEEGEDQPLLQQTETQLDLQTDPETGVTTKTTTTKKVVTSRSYHAVALDMPFPTVSPGSCSSNGGIHEVSTSSAATLHPFAVQPRLVSLHTRQLQQMTIESISGHLIVTHVNPDANLDIRPGDCVLEVDGKAVHDLSILLAPLASGHITLSLSTAAIHHAPMDFYRLLSDTQDSKEGSPWLSFDAFQGQVVQVLSKGSTHWQVRKLTDLRSAGQIPGSLPMERVALLAPFGRRVLALVGAPSVGRRTIKTMLLQHAPHLFATAVPLTSRAMRIGEAEGVEYHFVRKESIKQLIRDHSMVEWGELDNQLYGTSCDSVREVIRSGRLAVLDCAPQALPVLHTNEWMPFVVHIKPPQLDEAVHLETLRKTRRSPELLQSSIDFANEIECKYRRFIHLTLVNRNTDVTFKRLVSALEELRLNTQWVPYEWL